MYFLLAVSRFSKDTSRVIAPAGSILFPPKPDRGFVASLSYLLS
jgi:hypothetical protein